MELNDILNAFNENQELRKAFVNHLNESKENQKIIQPVIDPIVSNIHGMYEADMLEVTGVEKPANEQGYKFYKRYLKDEISKIQSLDSENKELKTNLENGLKGSDAEWQAKIEALKNDHALALQAKADELQSFENQRKFDMVHNELKNEFSKRKIKEDLKNIVSRNAELELKQIADNANINPDGTITFNKDGEIWRNENYQVLTPKDVINTLYSDVFDNGNNQSGGGSTQMPSSTNGTGKTGVALNWANVRTRVDVYNAVVDSYKADGKEAGGTEFQADLKAANDQATQQFGADMPKAY